jgi:hypothetical protein
MWSVAENLTLDPMRPEPPKSVVMLGTVGDDRATFPGGDVLDRMKTENG